jgi:hypothetical protein
LKEIEKIENEIKKAKGLEGGGYQSTLNEKKIELEKANIDLAKLNSTFEDKNAETEDLRKRLAELGLIYIVFFIYAL